MTHSSNCDIRVTLTDSEVLLDVHQKLTVTAPLAPHTGAERSYTRALKTRAFTEALDGRDVYLGKKRCVVCGAGQTEHCCILPDTDSKTWAEAKAHGCIPAHAAELPGHPNNGLLLCATHNAEFQSKSFFIRYLPEHRKFIFLNLSATPHLQPFHTKAIALDPDDRNAALPTLFLLHELRARAKYPFQSVDAEYPFQRVDAVLPPADSSKDIEWQDWITSSDILRSSACSSSILRPSACSSSILRPSASSPYFHRAAQGP